MFGKGMGNMAGMMKKVQKMQADMKKMQEELKIETVEDVASFNIVMIPHENPRSSTIN